MNTACIGKRMTVRETATVGDVSASRLFGGVTVLSTLSFRNSLSVSRGLLKSTKLISCIHSKVSDNCHEWPAAGVAKPKSAVSPGSKCRSSSRLPGVRETRLARCSSLA